MFSGCIRTYTSYYVLQQTDRYLAIFGVVYFDSFDSYNRAGNLEPIEYPKRARRKKSVTPFYHFLLHKHQKQQKQPNNAYCARGCVQKWFAISKMKMKMAVRARFHVKDDNFAYFQMFIRHTSYLLVSIDYTTWTYIIHVRQYVHSFCAYILITPFVFHC